MHVEANICICSTYIDFGVWQEKMRPWVVVQNDVGNRYSSTTVVVPLTDATRVKKASPIYVLVRKGDGGATKDSYVLCDQIRTVDQRRFGRFFGTLARETMDSVDRALLISLGLSTHLRQSQL